jgi:hypothetical protein
MDARRFDRMSKFLVAATPGTPRRTLLRGIAGAAVVALGLAQAAGADPKAKFYSCCLGEKCLVGALTREDIEQFEAQGFVCEKFKSKSK